MSEGFIGATPAEAFDTFRQHLNTLINGTITDAPLLQTTSSPRFLLEFRQNGKAAGVPVGDGYYLFLTQTLVAKKIGFKKYRLGTLAYAYRIAEGPAREDKWIVRWEYNSRENLKALHPRHHCHLPAELLCFDNRVLNLKKMHISSGWVTIEEVIRFLIQELKVKPKNIDWDKRLRDSEKKFRDATARSI